MRLTVGELKVMRLLWEHGEMKPPEILKLYGPSIKDPALRACLAILVEKGHAIRRRAGRAYFYKAVTPEQRAYKSMLRELIDNFCDGSARQLILNLAEQEKLSDADLKEIQQAAKQNGPLPRQRKKTKQSKK